MIEAVLLFGLISATFEAVILMKIPPRIRLRILGSASWILVIHAATILFNLVVHFGTITGTMSATIAGLASFIIVPLIRYYTGCIRKIRMSNGRQEQRYFPGIKRYTAGEIA
jgi:hypothetical protein